jgi:predicted dehydrogenase
MSASSSLSALDPTPICVIGGGMITRLQILPSLYQLQRNGTIGDISISARNAGTLEALAADGDIARAFPGHSFAAQAGDYHESLAALPSGSIVYVAIPDQFHFDVIRDTLEAGHHVIAVKPLVLDHKEAVTIADLAREKVLFVGVEYHKRYDDKNWIARKKYRAGDFGEFKLGHARLHEKWWYRDSNFQNWCTTDETDFFTYIGCHYVDLVAFITGLKPVAVSVHGIEDAFPNGNIGYLYTDARVIWENGAVLNVQNGIAYPNQATAGNDQGMRLYTKDDSTGVGGFIDHSDNIRGADYCAIHPGADAGDNAHHQVNPDYFQMLERPDGDGLRPVGYGFRAIEQLVDSARTVIAAGEARGNVIDEIDSAGWHATPANSSYNELVVEAGRLSILNGGRRVDISYGPDPGVAFAD